MASKELPSEREFQLLTLVVSERVGREVAKLYERYVGKAISYGTLYSTFKRLKDAGWVTARDSEDEDGRLRYFRITGSGVRVQQAARERYQRLSRFGCDAGEVAL